MMSSSGSRWFALFVAALCGATLTACTEREQPGATADTRAAGGDVAMSGDSAADTAATTMNVPTTDAGAVDPQDVLAVELEVMRDDLGVVGVFHSHPDHPPIASPRDLAWAGWDVYSYLITEITAAGAGASRSWRVLPERSGFVEEIIHTVDDGLESPGGFLKDK